MENNDININTYKFRCDIYKKNTDVIVSRGITVIADDYKQAIAKLSIVYDKLGYAIKDITSFEKISERTIQ